MISALWKKGEFEGRDVGRFKAVGSIFGGKKGIGQKKAIVVEKESRGPGLVTAFLYYPKPREALQYMLAAKHLRSGGFADTYPGCVGGLTGVIYSTSSMKTARIYTIQGAFLYGKSPEISGSLARKHGGWRKHILSVFFERMNAEEISRITFKRRFPNTGTPADRIKRQLDDFLDIAKEYGFERVKSHTGTLIVVERKN